MAEEVPPHGLVLATMPAEELGQQPAPMLFRVSVRGVGRDDRGVGEALGQGLDPRLSLGDILRQRLALAGAGDRSPGRLGQFVPQCLEPVAELQVADDVVAVVALDAVEDRRVRTLALPELQPFLERDDARSGIPKVDLTGEPVERLHPLDGVALDRRAQRLADGSQQVDERASPQEGVDLVLACAVAAHEALERGRLVRRVVVDVQVRVGAEPLADEVHHGLERAPFAIEAELACLVTRPERVERAVDLEDAEQVVEPVVEGVRVALEIEEQVAGRRRRQRGETAFLADRVIARGAAGARSAGSRRGALRAGSAPVPGRGAGLPCSCPRASDPSAAASRRAPRVSGSPRSIRARRWRAEIPATRLR